MDSENVRDLKENINKSVPETKKIEKDAKKAPLEE